MDNIIENNKLIAEFMGFIADKSFEVKLVDGINTSYYYYKDDVMCLPETMRYNSSWNWLMEVVEKIESLGNDILITSNYIQITYDKGEKFITIELEGNIKIFAVYNACIEFIKWYNKQNKNNEKHLHITDRKTK